MSKYIYSYNTNSIPTDNNFNKLLLYKYHEDKGDIIPNNIKYIKLEPNNCYTINALPISIKTLKFNNDKFTFKYMVKINNLPNSIRKLYVDHHYNNHTNNLPNLIETLFFNFCFKKKINNLPNSIRKLNVGILFKHKIINFPNNLNTLLYNVFKGYTFTYRLFCTYNNELDNLPSTLNKLVLQNNYKGKLNLLPNGLHILKLRTGDNCDINLDNLPTSLIRLEILCNYLGNLDFLPEGLKILKIYNCEKEINDLPSSLKKLIIDKNCETIINECYFSKLEYKNIFGVIKM